MVGAPLEFERNRFDGDARTASFQKAPAGLDVWRTCAVEADHRKHAHLGGDPREFRQGVEMELQVKLTAVEEQEM